MQFLKGIYTDRRAKLNPLQSSICGCLLTTLLRYVCWKRMSEERQEADGARTVLGRNRCRNPTGSGVGGRKGGRGLAWPGGGLRKRCVKAQKGVVGPSWAEIRAGDLSGCLHIPVTLSTISLCCLVHVLFPGPVVRDRMLKCSTALTQSPDFTQVHYLPLMVFMGHGQPWTAPSLSSTRRVPPDALRGFSVCPFPRGSVHSPGGQHRDLAECQFD
jgi:hypothetical protein